MPAVASGEALIQRKYTGISWGSIHTSANAYDWSLFDTVWAKLKAKGVTDVTYVFEDVPAWNGGGTHADQNPTNLTHLANFATAVANRAVQNGLPISNFEIWNEPNSGTGWWVGTTAQMVAMGRTIYNAVKAVNPSYKVLTPTPQGNATTWMNGYLAAGGGQYADVIAFHGYTVSAPETILSLIDNYKTVMAAHGQSAKPLWDMEAMALTTFSTAAHATFLAVYYLVHASKGSERFYWYSWDQDEGKLWHYNGGINAAGVAYAQVVNWMLGATPGPVTVNGSIYSVSLTKEGKTSLVVWRSSGTSTFATSHTRVTNLAGVTSVVSGSITIGQNPVRLFTP